jgi:nitrogen-specific signal transduction histidine kinase
MSVAGGSPAGDPRLDAATRVGRALLHEVRNVLNPIVSAAWLLDANATDPEKVRDLARRIEGFANADTRLAGRMRALLAEESARLDDGADAGADAPSPPSS